MAVSYLWSIWCDALTSLLPQRLIRLLSGLPRPYALSFDEAADAASVAQHNIRLPLSALDDPRSAFTALRGRINGTAHIDVLLPAARTLIRDISAPKVSRRRALQIADLDLARTTPIDRFAMSWVNHPERLADGTWRIHQTIAKNELLDAIELAAQSAGLELRSISVLEQNAQTRARLRDHHRRATRPWRWWRRLELFALVAVASAVFIAVAAPLQDERAALVPLQARVHALSDEASELRAQLTKLESAAATLSVANTAIAAHPSVTELLNRLTKTLTDQIWLDQLSVKDGQITLVGRTRGKTTDIVRALEEVGSFHDAAIKGDVAFDVASKTERFRITATLRLKNAS